MPFARNEVVVRDRALPMILHNGAFTDDEKGCFYAAPIEVEILPAQDTASGVNKNVTITVKARITAFP